METFRRFCSYWWGNLKVAHERREIAMIIIGAGGLLLTFLAYIFGFSTDPRYAAWGGIVSGSLLVIGLFSSPFQRHEKLTRKHAEDVANLNRKHADEIARLNAEIEGLKIRYATEIADLKARLDQRKKRELALRELGRLQFEWNALLAEILNTPDDNFDAEKSTTKTSLLIGETGAFLQQEFSAAEAAAFWSTADIKLTRENFWPKPQQWAIDQARHFTIQLKRVIERQSTAE